MTDFITPEEALVYLAHQCAVKGGQARMAEKAGVTPAAVCQALSRKRIGPKIQAALGLRAGFQVVNRTQENARGF